MMYLLAAVVGIFLKTPQPETAAEAESGVIAAAH